ncbi:MAG: NAD(P)/FAD-dependent oxidoreductase, partial [Acidimicrobiia bacterium]|nr:NAD(P)/FAD-dependent oxidoreductase [Acidimicrobiia bacterium]
MKRVIIIGGGFAGAEAARRLGNKLDVTLVSDDNYLLFTPMLAEVAAGDIEPRHIIAPLRQLCPKARVVVGEVTVIDLDNLKVTVRLELGRDPIELAADAIVLASGGVPSTHGVAGVAEHGLTFKNMLDALRIRRRVPALLEAAATTGDARLLEVAVIGAGYSGVELAAGLMDFMVEARRRFYPEAPRPKVTLLDFGDRVAPMLPKRMSAKAAEALKERQVDVRLGAKVVEVVAEGVLLDDGSRFEAGTTIWTAGVRGAELGSSVPGDKKHDRVLVDENLRTGTPGVYAMGDAAVVPDGRGGICPPTAQHALRQGKYFAEHLPDLMAGKKVKRFMYQTRGQLVSVGHRNAVGSVLGIPVSGFIGWFMWRSYYLLRLP